MGNESKFDINLFLFDVVTLLFSISESRLYPISGEEKILSDSRRLCEEF